MEKKTMIKEASNWNKFGFSATAGICVLVGIIMTFMFSKSQPNPAFALFMLVGFIAALITNAYYMFEANMYRLSVIMKANEYQVTLLRDGATIVILDMTQNVYIAMFSQVGTCEALMDSPNIEINVYKGMFGDDYTEISATIGREKQKFQILSKENSDD